MSLSTSPAGETWLTALTAEIIMSSQPAVAHICNRPYDAELCHASQLLGMRKIESGRCACWNSLLCAGGSTASSSPQRTGANAEETMNPVWNVAAAHFGSSTTVSCCMDACGPWCSVEAPHAEFRGRQVVSDGGVGRVASSC